MRVRPPPPAPVISFTEIDFHSPMESLSGAIVVADDVCGMESQTPDAAIRPGSQSPLGLSRRAVRDLGRFGQGFDHRVAEAAGDDDGGRSPRGRRTRLLCAVQGARGERDASTLSATRGAIRGTL